MADTELTRTRVHSPYVDITVSDYGRVTARLEAYRDKPRGGEESISLAFINLDRSSLACIAGEAIRALRRLREVQDRQIVESIERATGWEEGNGPGGLA